MAKDSSFRGHASQFFVAAELCRKNYCAVVTMGNTPNTDILCSNKEGTKFVHIQVKTFKTMLSNTKSPVGGKAEKNYGENFFWILCGFPGNERQQTDITIQYYIIPSKIMANNVKQCQDIFRQNHSNGKEFSFRAVHIPPYSKKHKNANGWGYIAVPK